MISCMTIYIKVLIFLVFSLSFPCNESYGWCDIIENMGQCSCCNKTNDQSSDHEAVATTIVTSTEKKESVDDQDNEFETTDFKFSNLLEKMREEKEKEALEEEKFVRSLSENDRIGYELLKLLESNQSELFIQKWNKLNKAQLEYMVFKYESPDLKKTLFLAACEHNNRDITKLLFDLNADINATDEHGRSPFYWCLGNGDIETAIRIGEKGGNVNDYDRARNYTTMHGIMQHGTVEMIEISIKYGYDFEKYINFKAAGAGAGATPLLIACQNGRFDCIKFIFDYEKIVQNKLKRTDPIVNLYDKIEVNGMNVVHICCHMNRVQILDYLIQHVNILTRKNNNFINETDNSGRTPLFVAARQDNLEVLELLDKRCKEKNLLLDLNESGQGPPILGAAAVDSWKCVEWLANHPRCDANKEVKKCSALFAAILNGCHKSVKVLCQCKKVNVFANAWRDIQWAVAGANIGTFEMLLYTFMKRLEIDNWDLLRESKLLDLDSIAQWKMVANKNIQEGKNMPAIQMLAFLDRLEKEIILKENFDLLNIMLENDCNNVTSTTPEIELKLQKCIKISSIVSSFIKYCEMCCKDFGIDYKQFSSNLSKSINTMMENKCVINDMLMILSNRLNPIEFEKGLKNCIYQCIAIESKKLANHPRDIVWYKQCILISSVLSLPSSSNPSMLLFDIISKQVIENELNKQRQFIKDEITKMQAIDKQHWDHLISYKAFNLGIGHNILTQQSLIDPSNNDLMKNNGIISQYKQHELIENFLTGFNGKEEYDRYGYLTDLLIGANKLNPIFQKDCQNLLNEKMLGVWCHFTTAPLKTKERCQIKAAVDYSGDNHSWPSTTNILDLMRCSVSFKTAKDLLAGLEKFKAMVGANDSAYIKVDKGCIYRIVRIKNMFGDIKNWDENKLSDYSYCDIKVNVLVGNLYCKMIAEIQFMLNFMVDAKKLGHVYYGFIRNEDLHHAVANKIESRMNSDSSIVELKSIIIQKNWDKLVKFVLYGGIAQLLQKRWYKISQVIKLCKLTEWQVGYDLILFALKNGGADNCNNKTVIEKIKRLGKFDTTVDTTQTKLNVEINYNDMESKDTKDDHTYDDIDIKEEQDLELETTTFDAGKFKSLSKDEQAKKFAQYITNNDVASVKLLLSSIDSKARKYLLCKAELEDKKTIPLFAILNGAKSGDLSIMLSILQYINDMNVNTITTLFRGACSLNLSNIVEILITKIPTVNISNSENITPMWQACYCANLKLMKLYVSNGFDFEKYINLKKMPEGFSCFHICIQSGNLECVKYLVNINKSKFKNKCIDYCATTTAGEDMLTIAINQNVYNIGKYLIQELNILDKIDINQKRKDGSTLLHYCATQGQLDMLQLLRQHCVENGKQLNYAAQTSDGVTALHSACSNKLPNGSECVKWFIDRCNELDAKSNGKINYGTKLLNTVTNDQETGLMCAVRYGNVKTVSYLVNAGAEIESITNTQGKNVLDIAVEEGQTKILQILLKSLINKYNVVNVTELDKLNIISIKMIDKWTEMARNVELPCFVNGADIDWELMRKLAFFVNPSNDQTIYFLQDLKHILSIDSNDRFELFVSRVEFGNTDNVSKQEIDKKCDQLSKVIQIVKDLQQTVKDKKLLHLLAQIINRMIQDKQPIDDTLLCIAAMFDKKNFLRSVNQSIKESIYNNISTNNNNYVYSVAWYKECIEHSTIFALPLSDYIDDDTKDDSKDDSKFDSKDRNYNCVFNSVYDSTIKPEIMKQKSFIRNHVKQLLLPMPDNNTSNSNSHFETLLNQSSVVVSALGNQTQQNSIKSPFFRGGSENMKNFMWDGVQPKYKESGLIDDYYSGFNGSAEYDYNGYLTDLILVANMINPIFQSDCKLLFSEKYLGAVPCLYKAAPIKTRQSCQIKASLKYNNHPYPHTSNLIDIIRCSVTFKNPKDLLDTLNALQQMVTFNETEYSFRSLNRIVRIKNSFNEIKNWNLNTIDDCHYCDVTLNVIVKYSTYAIVAEIKFLLQFMLDAKKMGYHCNNFIKNKYLIDELSHHIQNKYNFDQQLKTLKSVIARKDFYLLSKLVLNGTVDKLTKSHEINFKSLIILSQKVGWYKGLKLLQSVSV